MTFTDPLAEVVGAINRRQKIEPRLKFALDRLARRAGYKPVAEVLRGAKWRAAK